MWDDVYNNFLRGESLFDQSSLSILIIQLVHR